VAFLHAKGFLSAPTLTKESLTAKGTMATEVNEGHPILMTELYSQGLCKGLTCAETVAVLAAFMTEGEKDEQPSLQSLRIPEAVKKVLGQLGEIACDAAADEKPLGIESPAGYWNLSTTWIEPIYRWMDGEDPSVLCADYGLFEGNLMRSILKASNLVEEWTALATFSQDTVTLETMRDSRAMLHRSIAVTDSLYLRL